jgi:hypothetical protein
MANYSNNPSRRIRLQGDARKEKLIVLKSARKYRELNKWYSREAQGLRMAPTKVAEGLSAELQIFVLGKLSLQDQPKKQAVEILTEDGRNMSLMVEAQTGIPYKKADFLARIDHALKILPEVKEDLLKEIPHGREIIAGLPEVRRKLAADPRQNSIGGAGIMHDISLINMLKLRQIIGDEKFNQLTRLTGEIMREIIKRGY